MPTSPPRFRRGRRAAAWLTLSVAGIVAAAETPPAIFDGEGRPAVVYRVDAIFNDGVILRTAAGTRWLKIAPGDHALRERVLAGQNTPPASPPIAAGARSEGAGGVPPSPPPASGYGASSAGFTFSPARRQGVATMTSRLEDLRAREELRDAIVERVPGAASPRELPWEFVANEFGMLVLWFQVADESQPENRAISNYIVTQHAPPMLLYRLLIRPFLPRKPRED